MSVDIPIAIIGAAYRAPGVGRKGLWEFLSEARSAWSSVPPDRFQQSAFQHPDPEKPGFFASTGAHFLPDDIYAFDPAFFNITADEARTMDPQHRVLMECAFEACESAGLSLPSIYNKQIGVFSAHGQPEYAYQAFEDLPTINKFTSTGVGSTMFANRLSHWFGLRGPSATVDAACASGSYAVHMACQSIRSGECNSAFVGGCSLIISPVVWSLLDTLGALSSEGKCFSYDSRAAGFGRGEGAGCIILKRLPDALKDGDPIRAIIRNTAVGHSGKTDGIALPSGTAQADLLLKVHQDIGISPADTLLVEGHGTGTAVGDPIEANAVASVLGKDRTPDDPVFLGSIKSNFGHLEGASGVIATIKAMMMVEKGHILPTAWYEEMNPSINEKDKLRVLQKTVSWPSDGRPRRVCVSNFGFGGSNAVAILEEPPKAGKTYISDSEALAEINGHTLNGHSSATNGFSNGVENSVANGVNGNHVTGYTNGLTNGHQQESGSTSGVYAFSAKSDVSLQSYLSTFSSWLDTCDGNPEFLRDLAFTLGSRRSHFPYRFAVAADSITSLKTQIQSFSKSTRSRTPSIAFIFTGQGAQYAGMAAELYGYKCFRETMRQAEDCLHKFGAEWSLREEIARLEAESRINHAEISQPACTAVQIALVCQLKQWGIHPDIVAGHSSGEIASAYAAGVLSLEAAMAVAYYRGRAAAQISNDKDLSGAMLAVGVGADEAETLIQQHQSSGYATVAAMNSPGSVTISGDANAITAIHKAADEQGLFVRRLKIGVAYHSRHMEKVAATYLTSIVPWCKVLESANDSKVVFVSSVTGRVEAAKALGPSYWVSNLLQPVRFMDAVKTIISSGETSPTVLLEVGPHAALKNPIKQILDSSDTRSGQEKAQGSSFMYFPTLLRGEPADGSMLSMAVKMFSAGTTLDLAEINTTSGTSSNRVLTHLPAYEWNHSVRYILQNRVTQQKQQPGHAYHPLLGWKSPYSEGRTHTFRQILSLDEMPWIRDHNIDYNAIFPMTGYICMAAAALKAIRSAPTATIVRDFHAKRGLRMHQEDRVEVFTRLTPLATGSEAFSATGWSFEISSWTQATGWTTHCHGVIEPDANEDISKSATLLSRLPLLQDPNLQPRDPLAEYNLLAKNGMRYEGIFRSMDKLSTAPSLTVMENQARRLDSSFTDITTIDPPMLDAFMHSAPVSVEVAGEENIRPTYMPVSFDRLRLPASLPSCKDHRFTTITELLEHETKAGEFRIRMSAFRHDEETGQLQPVVEWDSALFKAVSRHETKASTLGPIPGSYYVKHVPSIEFWDVERMLQEIATTSSTSAQWLENAPKSVEVARYFMSRSLANMTEQDLAASRPSHLTKCINWMQRTVAGKQVISDQEAGEMITAVSSGSAQGELLCAIGQNLTALIRDEMQPLEIMLRDGLLARGYEADEFLRCVNGMLGKYARKLVEANPYLRILEIGAGTGSSTMAIFEGLSENAGPELYRHLEYTYTDISTGFFDDARVKLSTYVDHIIFKKLDISRDPCDAQQGFEPESYDLIVAGNVLHATPHMKETLQYTRKLLRPGGHLALVEYTEILEPMLPFATLPGWWLAEDDYRSQDGPLLSESAWEFALRDTGFSGAELIAKTNKGTFGESLALISSTRVDTVPAAAETQQTRNVTIWGQFADNRTSEFAELIASELDQHHGCHSSIRRLQEIETYDKEQLSLQSWNIVVDDASQSILGNVTTDKFKHVHKLLLNSGGLLWIIPRQHTPESTIAKGMLCVLRQEDVSRWILLCDGVPYNQDGSPKIADLLAKLGERTASRRQDQDFTIDSQTNEIYVPRLRMLENSSTPFLCEAGVPPRALQRLWEAAGDGALQMTMDSAGSPDSIFFCQSDILATSIGRNEVIIRVEAAGINFIDLLLVLGSIPWMPPGLEGAGLVTQVGEDVTNVAVGDHVFFMTEGSAIATHVRIPGLFACKIPDGKLTSLEAASMPLAYSTAFVALQRTANLQKGEKVLIHAASGAVGQACIAVAQAEGAEVFVTAGSPEKREFLHKMLGVPKTHIFNSRTPDFRDGILEVTKGRGVDVIINSLSGPLQRETWSLIADFGRFVELGRKDFLENSHLAMKPFDRNVTFSGIELQRYFEHRPEIIADCFQKLVQGMASGVVKPIQPVTNVPVSEIAAALRKLQSGVNIGKLVVTMGQDDRVLAEKRSPLGLPSAQILKKDATYLITGGTGGIGRSLARWLFNHGAGNVVLLGRSGSSRPEVAKIVDEYSNRRDGKCLRAISCDVSSCDAINAMLESISDLPKVRGIVHGALNISDSLFINATYNDWKTITDPKIRATWNMHHLCPDLDFFVTLGSIAGTAGHVGQSIYAGSSTFLDGFVSYRRSLGLPASNITLPVVLEVGVVAENNIAERLEAQAGVTMNEAQLHTTFKAALIGDKSGMLDNGKALVGVISKMASTATSYVFPFGMAALQRRIGTSSSSQNFSTDTAGGSGTERDTATGGTNSAARDLPSLVDALMHKVASMTLMEMDEVDAHQPLAEYGLDSLVSVELRNWIRRTANVDIPLARIVGAENLQALAERIWSLKGQ